MHCRGFDVGFCTLEKQPGKDGILLCLKEVYIYLLGLTLKCGEITHSCFAGIIMF